MTASDWLVASLIAWTPLSIAFGLAIGSCLRAIEQQSHEIRRELEAERLGCAGHFEGEIINHRECH